MRNNYKKSKKVKKQKLRASLPKPKHRQTQYNYNDYNDAIYYNTTNTPLTEQTQQVRMGLDRSGSNRPAQGRTTPVKTASKRTTTRKAKKRKTKFFISRIIFLIGFIIGVIYLISIVIDTTQKPVISYQMVQRGIIDNSDVFDGLIVRNEKVIPNTKEGNMYLLAAEGDKVKKNGQVYQILDSADATMLEESMQNVESDIEKMQAKRQEVSYYQNEIQAINNTINNNIEIYYMQAEPGKLEYTHELKKQLEYEIVKRKNVHMKDSTVALNELKDQKQDLSTQLRSNETIYRTLESGIISYYTDGFEERFTLDKLEGITEKDIKQKYTNISTTANQILGANEPAYRIIRDNDWKLVCFMPESWAEKFPVGKKHEFVLIEDSNVEFTLKVEENIPEGKRHKIIFSSNEQLDLIASTRTLSFKSLQYMYEGLKIPTSAITERNLIKIPSDYIISSEDGKGIMKSLGPTGESMFLGLNVQYEDGDGFAYILQNIGEKEGLKLGDTIIHPTQTTSTYLVSEVSTVKGIYVVNGRITKFKSIETIAQNDDYLIVKSNATNGLKQFDQIVTNPKNIQEEQLLRNMDVKNIK
ncbi:MAG TPA: hypothetical protein GX707_08450 [Epulopiscium sp.]|nr:hypothetical protein [Candidatus Epulonipiscium sp.]